ncbi:MAG TPA: carbon-nitrogen hydrolase [Gammaproteobacteria bacterium]|nr:carbon-nitrogen hydrolase [Gammaproteobacteria bacterium]
MTDAILKAALLQRAVGPDREENLAATCAAIEEAAGTGARLVLLQELFATPYFCQDEDPGCFDLAESIPGPTSRRLAALAKGLGVVIVAPLFERRATGLYHNSAIVLDSDGSLAGIYRKMHIPDDPGYYEKFYFTPGDGSFRPIATRVGRLGVLICWDQWFPEAARLMALAGADLLLYPTAIGWDPRDEEEERTRQLEAWRMVQRGHAVANALPLLSCNRTGRETGPGREPGIHFWGASFACGPQGEILAEAPCEGDHLLRVDIDLGRTESVRRIWPFLRDRRIDAYGELARCWRD